MFHELTSLGDDHVDLGFWDGPRTAVEQGHLRSSRWEGGEGVVISMDYSASGDRWAWDYITPKRRQGRYLVYKRYFSCQLGDYNGS